MDTVRMTSQGDHNGVGRRAGQYFWAALSFVWIGALQVNSAFSIDPADCEKDDLPLEHLRACTNMISEDGTMAADRGRVYTMRGVAWMREEEPTAAISDFTRAIEVDAENIAALKGRARAYAAVKKFDKAVEDWSRVIAARPDAEENYRERADANFAAGKTSDALADYDRAIAIDNRNPESFIGKGRVYGELGKRDEAMREFDNALKVNPDYPAVYMARGAVSERLGDTRVAIESYQAVLKYDGAYWYAIRALQRLGGDWANHRRK